MSEKRCLIAICHNGPVVLTPSVKSLMEILFGNRVDEAKQRHGFAEIAFTWQDSFPRVDALRDASAMLALQEGQITKHVYKHRYSHILFLDADMAWPSDVLLRMLKHHELDVVSGFYCLKGGDFAPVAMKDGFVADGSQVTQYYHDRDFEETSDALREVQVVGMGCTLIKTEIFDAIGPRPWFEYANDDQGWPRVSEDVTFCQKARAAGYRIWWDKTVICKHFTVHGVDPTWHRAAANGPLEAIMAAAEHMEPREKVA
jgi:hypothetical protein